MDEKGTLPLCLTRIIFPDSARAAYSHPIAKLGPTGLRQWLLRVLPAQAESRENKLTSATEGVFSFLYMKDGGSVYDDVHPRERGCRSARRNVS